MRTVYPTLERFLPRFLHKRLFGDRKRWGGEVDANDPDWKAWLDAYVYFYDENQKKGVGKRVNDAGYAILRQVDLNGKRVLEIGPGKLPHAAFWSGRPSHFTVADIHAEFLTASVEILSRMGVPADAVQSSADRLTLLDAQFDIVISFYSLEHIVQLDAFVDEIRRVLRPGGLLVGGIPCEGGFVWGLGRYLTSRRYVRKFLKFDYDKIICWEHPNFAKRVLATLDAKFTPRTQEYWPLKLPLLDLNLICRFVYVKSP
tara:strand:- start:97 stop:870 length:774 start_codon:yes stop_codon:yes gene_type:complete